MSATMKYIFAGLCLLLSTCNIRAHQHQALQCWHCSSATVGSDGFCGVTFQEDNIPYEQLKESNSNPLRTCNSSINSDHERPVCRKTVDETNDGKLITKRFCYYTNKSDPVELCNMTKPDNNMRRIFCEDCLSDRCNGSARLAAILAAILLPSLAVAHYLAI
ncbi:uncharacterized protein LOC108603622 [Drosophila busckii]|nr:uncharacterized protein LOC108603622 [Drosophila busckii]